MQTAPSLSRAMPLAEQFLDQRGQPVLVKALAQRVVERHVEPPVHPLDFVLAERQELGPQPAVLRVAGVQFGGLGQHGRLYVVRTRRVRSSAHGVCRYFPGSAHGVCRLLSSSSISRRTCR